MVAGKPSSCIVLHVFSKLKSEGKVQPPGEMPHFILYCTEGAAKTEGSYKSQDSGRYSPAVEIEIDNLRGRVVSRLARHRMGSFIIVAQVKNKYKIRPQRASSEDFRGKVGAHG